MSKLFDTVIEFFEGEEWPFARLAGRTVLKLSARTDDDRWDCFADAREEEARFLFYSIAPVGAAEEQRGAAVEFLSRANYGLVLGNFELDFEDGTIRFKTSIDVEGDRLTPALIKQLVYPNVRSTGRYLPGLRAVLSGELSPAQAIARIEE